MQPNISTSQRKKRLSLELSFKMLGTEGKFAGYASVFDIADNQRDVIVRGAFQKTLVENRHAIKLLWQHDHQQPIGIFTHLFEDRHGLYVEGELLTSIPRAKEAYTLLKNKVINGLSIGYIPVKHTYNAEKNLRYISELELWEVSLVTFPANEAARVTVVKNTTPDSLSTKEYDEWKHIRQSGQLISLCEAIEVARQSLRS